MSRFAPYIGIALALLMGILIAVFSGEVATPPATSATTYSIASSSLTRLATTTSATTTSEKVVVPEEAVKPSVKVAKKISPQIVPTTPASISAPVLVSSANIPLDTVATSLRGALVNIICYASAGSGLRSISGSGIFIDSKGIILTNAHVALYFLLLDHGVSCSIRSGSPATDNYDAALIYISPAWIHANASVITQSAPSGTGEYDFALLAVTKSRTSAPLPSSFPSLPLAKSPLSALVPVVIASYGAQFLETSQVQSALFPTIVFGSIKEVFTFSDKSIDVLALGGSAAAQEGSSGGGVADASGTLIGTITTSTIQGATNTRSLNAITASYIRSEYSREMGNTLDTLIDAPIATSIADFAPQIPLLESILTKNLH